MSNVLPFPPREPTSHEGQLPPFDLDAECAVISAIMLDTAGAQMTAVADFLQPEHFYSEAHRRIYEAALELHAEGAVHDIVTIGNRLKATDRIGQVGGMPYLTEIINAAPAVTRMRDYAVLVFEAWRARQVIAAAQRVVALGYQGVVDVQAYADESTASIGNIARRSVGAAGQTNVETLKGILQELQDRDDTAKVSADNGMRGIPYGYPTLDAQTGGMHACELIYLIAGTGVGKTTMAMNVALHVASLGIGVQVFSTETGRKEWLEAAVSCLGRVDNAIWKARLATPPEWDRLTAASDTIASWKHLRIDETREPDVSYIASVCAARAATAKKVDGAPLGLIIVDNFHCLARGDDRRKRYDVLKEQSSELKELADKLKLPVVVPAQQRDNPFNQFTKLRARPESGMMADCRSAERDADKVMYLHRAPLEDGRNGKHHGESKTKVLLVMTKGRFAAREDIELRLVGPHGRFVDVAGETQDRIDPLLPFSRTMVDQDDDSERRYP